MALPSIGAHPRYVEELRVGGGYGSSPDGGVDVDKAGNVAMDGDLSAATATLETAANTPLVLRRDTSTAFNQLLIALQLKNSSGGYVDYAQIAGKIETNTDGSEDGIFSVVILKNGTPTTVLLLSQTGVQLPALPTSSPGGSGWLWNDGGTVKIT